jgi:DNA polymerase-1
MVYLASTRGYVRTVLGRRRRFTVGGDSKDTRHGYHAAFNAAVQGTAADMTKQAAVNIYKRHRFIPLMQVHDELVYSIPDRDMADVIKHEMEAAVELHVPVIADVHVGKNWASAKG